MNRASLTGQIKTSYQFFQNTTECLKESDSSYAPKAGMMTVAQQITHVAYTIDWFVKGAFSENGFDLDFEAEMEKVKKVTSIRRAREHLDAAVAKACEVFETKSDEEILAPIAQGPIMGGLPRYAIIGGIADHTAHHRGSLAIYARLMNKEPKMPYG